MSEMSSNGNVVILEENYYETLQNNRKMMIENIIFSEQIKNLCIEKKVVTGEHVSTFRTSEINAERIDCIIQSLQMKQSKYFISFCEILMMCGQPLIAQILQESATNDIEIDIDDLLNEMPMLKKMLRQKDKEQLQKYITDKAKMESMKAIVTHSKQNQRKESIARVSQIQQSWKFQKDIKIKERESDYLKEQLNSVEEQLEEKRDLLKEIKNELITQKKNQESELELASNFNAVNDRELQRAQTSQNLLKKALESVINRLRILIPNDGKETEKLLYESSEGQMKKYDVEKQVNIFTALIDKVLDMFHILATDNMNFEALKIEVRNVQRLLFPKKEISPSDNLLSITKEYQNLTSGIIQTLQSKLDLQDNFIHGRIAQEFIPSQFKNIQIPSFEREEYMDIINELKTKTVSLEALLAAKEKDFQKFVQQKVSLEEEIFLESGNPNGTNGDHFTGLKQQPGQNHVGKTDGASNGVIPFSYSSNYKSRPPKVYQNKLKRTNVLKFGSVNFL